MTATATTSAELLRPHDREQALTRFYRDGFVLIRAVLSPDEVATLRHLIDAAFDRPDAYESNNRYGDFVMVRLFEFDRVFRDMLVREPIIGFAEAILGDTCHLIAQNAVRNRPGQAIDQFHVDEVLEFPLPAEIPRHDPRVQMPVFRVTVQMPLTDLESEAFGPSQYVPGSHYSGRHPNDKVQPAFEGRGPVSVLCRAGDIYLHNGQCWHRGMPNRSDRTRYLLQQSYARRWVAQRFYPFLNYRMPDRVLEGAGERLLRVLGKHPKGAYG